MPTRNPLKIDPESRWIVTAGFSVDMDGVPFGPRVGTTWRASHPGIAHMLAHGGVERGLLVPADATEAELAAARYLAVTSIPYPETFAPDPGAPRILEPLPSARRLRATQFVVHAGTQFASPGDIFDSESGIAKSILKEYPGALVPDPEEAA